MRFIGIAPLLIAMSTGAVADNACYERIYDAAHLQKHKLQEVSKMRLDLQKIGDRVSGQIRAAFRELPDYLSSDVTCTAKQNSTSCEVDQNGGSFDFVPTAKGIKLTNTSQIRFGGVDDGVVVGREVEHRVFALVKTTCIN
jgi:hypothetical protein